MATEFEIKIKIGTEVDDARVAASVAKLDRALDAVANQTITPRIEVPDIELPKLELPPIEVPPLDIPDFDLPETKSISQLALDFDEATAAAKKLEAEQRKALAQLIASGDEGSDQYIELVAGIIDARKQSEELAQAQQKVNKIFDDLEPPPIPDVPAPKTSDLGSRIVQFNALSEVATRAAESIAAINQPAIEFESNLAAVGAITGQSGPELEKLGAVGRELALSFGGSVNDQLKSFQGVLSKFGAEVAETPAALALISENINVLSKASGDDAATSMGAITDSMLQFGLVTGDSMKDAETSTRIINGLAASAQVGAAEIPQVAEAILQAGVAAKGANLDFEATNAALQVLAVGGKTGSEAGVALRNVLGLLQNASGPAETAMSKLGTSSKELGEVLTTQGLGPAMEILRSGMNNLGSDAERNASLMQIFGTENSAAAGILLDNLDKLDEFDKGIRAGQEGMGAAFQQAAQRMDTAQGQIDRAQAAVQDAFISISQTLGAQVTAAASTFASLAPTLQGAAGLKELIPDGIFEKAASGLKGVLLPALGQLGILKRVNAAATVVETGAEIANTAAKGAQAVATGGATAAQWAFNTAILANPLFLLTAGIAVGIGALLLFADSTKDLGTALEDANAAKEEFTKADALATSAQKSSTELKKLADEFDNLKDKGDPESQKRFAEVASELEQRVPGAVVKVSEFNDEGVRTKEVYEGSTAIVRQFADEQKRIAEEARSNALANLDDQVLALSDSYREAIESQKELREERGGLQNLVSQGLGDVGSFDVLGNPFDSVKDDLSDVNAELAENQKKLNEARPQIEALVDTYQEMGLSAEQIAERTGFAIQQVREFKGELDGTLISSKDLEAAIAGMAPAQQAAVRATALHAEGFAQAQQKVDELNGKLADAKFGGDEELVKKLEGELSEAQKVADEKKVKLEAQLDKEGVQEALDAIPAEARSKVVPLTTTLDVVVSDKSLSDTQQKASGLAREISELQAEQAKAIGTAQEGAYDDKLLAKQKEFRSNLETQATAIGENEAKLKTLQAQKAASMDPKETARLNGEIATLQAKTDEASKKFVLAAQSGKRVGAIQGDVKNVGTEFGLTGKAAEGAAAAVGQIDESNKRTKQSAADLAAEFQRVRSEASSGLEAAKQEAIGLLARIKTELDETERKRLQELYNQAIERAKKSAQGTIEGDKTIREVENQIGATSLSERERREEEARRKAEEAARKRREDNEKRVRAQLETERTQAQDVVNAMADGLAKQIAQADLDIKFKARENEMLEKLDRDALRRGELLQAEFRANEAKRTSELKQLQRDRRKVIEDAVGEIGTDFLGKEVEALKVNSETLKGEADRIADRDAESIQRRTSLLVSALRDAATAQVNEIIAGSAEFNETVAREAKPQEDALIAAKAKLIEAQNTGDQGQIDAAQRVFSDAQAAYEAKVRLLRDQFLQAQLDGNTVLGQTITNALAKSQQEINVTFGSGVADSYAAARREVIATESDLRRQELLLAKIGVDEKLQQDLEANKLNEAKKLQLIREANRQKRDLEEQYLRETNVLWDAAYVDLSTIVSGFFNGLTDERRRDLQKQSADLDVAMDRAKESLLRGSISIAEFDEQIAESMSKQQEIFDELGGSTRDFWENLIVGADAAFSSLEKIMTTRLDDGLSKLNVSLEGAISDAGDAAADTAGSMGDKLDSFFSRFESDADDVLTKLVDVGNAAAGQVLSIWGQMAITGRATIGDFADAAIISATRSIRTIIEGNIIAIIAAAFAINPFIGLGSIAAVLALEVMLAKWEADAQSRLGENGFKRGGYTGDGNIDDEAGVVHRREFVNTAEVTAANRDLLEHLHAGGSQIDWFAGLGTDLGFVTIADLDAMYIDVDGRLRSGFDGVAALEHQIALSETLRSAERAELRAAASRAFQAESFAHFLETESALGELRANREATLAAGNQVTSAVLDQTAKLEAKFDAVAATVRALTSYIELRDFDEKHAENEMRGRKGRGESQFGLLREIRDELHSLRRGR